MANVHNLVVGQKLFFVESTGKAKIAAVEITAVGRKWVSVPLGYSNSRIHIESMIEDRQFGSPGRCYVSREEIEEIHLRNKLWREFLNAANNNRTPPKNMSNKDIENVIRQLNAEN